MIGMKATTQDMTPRVEAAATRAAAGNARAAAFLVQQFARQSITKAPPTSATTTKAKIRRNAKGQFLKGSGRRKSRKSRRQASPAGTPPHTKRGLIKHAIQYAVDDGSAVIGTAHSIIGEGGKPHEDGGEYMGAHYPERAFMNPALERVAPIWGGSFAGSIGGSFIGSIGGG